MGAHVSYITPGVPHAWIKTAQAIQVAKFTSVASLSIAVYDYFACLDEEIDLICGSPRRACPSLFKYLALLCRYSGLFFPIVLVTLRLGDWNMEECRKLSYLQIIASDFVILSSNFVLALRTAAVYSFERKVCSIIASVILLQVACAIAASTRWDMIPLPQSVPGCFPRPGPARSLNISLYWPPALLTDLVLFVLTTCKVFPIWNSSQGNSRLSWVMLRDEILYYGLVSSLTVATNVLMYQSNRALGPMIVPLSITLSAVLVFHMVLNVRVLGRSPSPPSTSLENPVNFDEILAATCMASTARNVFRASVVAVEVVSERISEDGEEPMTETNPRLTMSEPPTQGYWDRVHAWDSDSERARKTSSGVTRQTV